MNKFQQNQIIFFIFILLLILFIVCDYKTDQLENFIIYSNYKNTHPGYGGYGSIRGIPNNYNEIEKCETELINK